MRFNDIPRSTAKTILSCTFEDFDIHVTSLEDDGYDPYSSKHFNPQNRVTAEFTTSYENNKTLLDIFRGYSQNPGCSEALLFDMILGDKLFKSGIITELRTPPHAPMTEPVTTFTIIFTKWEHYCEPCAA